jgi:hypothetical protein
MPRWIGWDMEQDGRKRGASDGMGHVPPCCVRQVQAWEAPSGWTTSRAGMGAGCALGAGLHVSRTRIQK